MPNEENDGFGSEDQRQPPNDITEGDKPDPVIATQDIPINDARASEKILSLLSFVSTQLESLSEGTAQMERAVSAIKPSSASEPILAQILTVYRETLVKVNTPSETASDLIEPILRDLIKLVFDMDKLLQADLNGTLETIRDVVVDIAERYGVEFYAPAVGDPFIASEARAMETTRVGQEKDDGRVAGVLRRGCRFQGKLLAYPHVSVFRYSAEPANT